MKGKTYIGTSGWTYKHWRTNWYKDVRPKDFLSYSAEHFTGLEANGTFYRLTKRSTFESWRDSTPPDFRFCVKAHRYLTHRKKLKDISEGIQKQKEGTDGLGEKLAVVLWQLPANFGANIERLEEFLENLKAWDNTRHAIEFRQKSWFTEEVSRKLAEAKVAVCISDSPKWPMWETVTTDIAYVRLHGHTQLYASNYSETALEAWSWKIRKWMRSGDVHVYFDNDALAHAPYNAVRLMEMVGEG
ncbi:MAG TPA: DUF72 domain-containing protein [Fimbriimonadaceae bacterium]